MPRRATKPRKPKADGLQAADLRQALASTESEINERTLDDAAAGAPGDDPKTDTAATIDKLITTVLELGKSPTFAGDKASRRFYQNTVERLLVRHSALLELATERLATQLASETDVKALAVTINTLSTKVQDFQKLSTSKTWIPQTEEDLDAAIKAKEAELEAAGVTRH